MRNERLALLTDYPFQRLTELLGGPATADALVMSIGEPQAAPPPMVERILTENTPLWGKYPPIPGTPDYRRACAEWLNRRFSLPDGLIDADRHVLPVAGTREALYMIAQVVCPTEGAERPVVLLPNPFYQVYAGAAVMAGAEPVYVPATAATGHLPDYAALPEAILNRTALAFYNTPANPQGSVATPAQLTTVVELARRHGFVLASDECYSEIYDTTPPAGALEACARLGGGLDHVVVFHSLSKRSGVPGLRCGFVAGDARVIAAFSHLRSYGGATVPLPILAAGAALWRDESHVDANRAVYRAKTDAAERLLGGRFGFHRPPGGFFLWLDVGDGEAAALKLWHEARIRVLPGRYLARDEADGANPGARYLRVALVHDLDTTRRALARLADIL